MTTAANSRLELDIKKCEKNEILLAQSSNDVVSKKLIYQMNNLEWNSYYTILANNNPLKRIKSNKNGIIIFVYKTNNKMDEIIVSKQ